ncbi:MULTISPECIES: XkdN-like protein [unclassified Paenibacillus]|uniref:phage tail assembly chaperone n=1 Tax=unclassified Paenibacillus TaxID=185978 RepID=UPI001C109A62|nr:MULTISPECIES: XkdN-like protein [unclassified Paenibacillus]MBU5444319.1 XkdN-like protein [Paenibacillus sp. MSJ-34]CAH0121048.1 hypothetical protein PAE9249_03574 [Paenibacillus sp. CECT 9249]
MSKNTLDLLLKMDKTKIQRPTEQVELKRLSDLLGEPVVFTCQALTMDEFEEIQNIAISFGKKGEVEDISTNSVQIFTLIKGIVDPSLKDAALLEAYGAATPKQLIEESKLLLPGEVTQLYNVISSLSGFGEDSVQTLKNG